MSVLVRKSITVAAPPPRAFRVFTADMSRWWPLATHHIGAANAVAAVVEPRTGGRWFERGEDGSECTWGHVVAWEPDHRLVLAWEIGADWRHDAALYTEVEVRFTAIEGGTRVELEHRKLEAYGPAADTMAGILGGDGGWTGMLGLYAAATAA